MRRYISRGLSLSYKIEFLYKSIEDIQSTIRAIDIKAGFLFVVIFLPVTVLDKIFVVGYTLSSMSLVYWLPIIPAVIFWGASLYLLFKTLLPIANPREKIKGEKPSGIFYGANLFALSKYSDCFFNSNSESNTDVNDYVDQIPNEELDIIKELTFEKMKITYIRDIKIIRSNLLIKTTYLWLIFGVVSWIMILLLNTGTS